MKPEIQLQIIGSIGSGKSTLLSLISAMLDKHNISYTLLEDVHVMKINMSDFLNNRK